MVTGHIQKQVSVWGDNNPMRWGQGVALNNISDTTFNEGDSSEHGGHKVILDYLWRQ